MLLHLSMLPLLVSLAPLSFGRMAKISTASSGVLDDARQIHGPEIITIWPVDDTAIQLGESCGRCEAEVAGDSLSKTVFPEFECSRRHQTGPFGILRLVGTCLIR